MTVWQSIRRMRPLRASAGVMMACAVVGSIGFTAPAAHAEPIDCSHFGDVFYDQECSGAVGSGADGASKSLAEQATAVAAYLKSFQDQEKENVELVGGTRHPGSFARWLAANNLTPPPDYTG